MRAVVLMGMDDATLVGAPRKLKLGTLADIRRPDAIIVDEAGYRELWPGEPLTLGKTLEMNDRRGVVVPAALDAMMADNDPARAKRVTDGAA